MEIKSLRYFLAVVREENMTKAADMLHVTQPTLTPLGNRKPSSLMTSMFNNGSHFRKASGTGCA